MLDRLEKVEEQVVVPAENQLQAELFQVGKPLHLFLFQAFPAGITKAKIIRKGLVAICTIHKIPPF